MHFDITYRTSFTYGDLVRESQNELRACPTSDDHQSLISYRVSTTPAGRVMSFEDYWGTRVDTFGVRHPHLVLEVVAEASVATLPRPVIAGPIPSAMLQDPTFTDQHCEYLEPSPHAAWGTGVTAAAAQALAPAGDDVIDWILALHHLTSARIQYRPGTTSVGVGVEDVLDMGAGVCQDYAHLAVALCRSVGIPARYVSGYLFAADDATGEDSADDLVRVQTHAWFEAATPGHGWLALDPTNRLDVGERHVKIAHGRDYDDVLPIRGVFSGSAPAVVEATVEIRRAVSEPASSGRPQPPFRSGSGASTQPSADIRRSRQHQQHQSQQ